MKKLKETYKDGIAITDLKKGDVIYVQKMESGFSINYECKFISFKKGIVTAEIVDTEPDWALRDKKGEKITARKSKCFLYGKGKNNKWTKFHWFR